MDYLIPIAIGIQRRKNGKEQLMVFFILSSFNSRKELIHLST
jgi:hypothetical protein